MPFKKTKIQCVPALPRHSDTFEEVSGCYVNLEVSDLDLQEEFKAEYGLSSDALFVDNEVNKGGNRLENYARALERSKR